MRLQRWLGTRALKPTTRVLVAEEPHLLFGLLFDRSNLIYQQRPCVIF